jgi:hypothetical protein
MTPRVRHLQSERKTGRRTRFPDERVAKMARLHDEEGLSWSTLGERFGTHGSHCADLVAAWKRRSAVPTSPAGVAGPGLASDAGPAGEGSVAKGARDDG